jgi:hypothetical protein
VQGAEGDRFQDQHIERALQEIELFVHEVLS